MLHVPRLWNECGFNVRWGEHKKKHRNIKHKKIRRNIWYRCFAIGRKPNKTIYLASLIATTL